MRPAEPDRATGSRVRGGLLNAAYTGFMNSFDAIPDAAAVGSDASAQAGAFIATMDALHLRFGRAAVRVGRAAPRYKTRWAERPVLPVLRVVRV